MYTKYAVRYKEQLTFLFRKSKIVYSAFSDFAETLNKRLAATEGVFSV